MYTYSYKLYNSDKNKHLLHKIRVACWIYNYCIAMSRRYYRLYGKTINFNKLKKRIAKKRNTTNLEWKAINSQTVQDIIERMERSYKSFFRLQKNGKRRAKPPRFIKSTKYSSITYKQVGWKLNDNKIILDGRVYTFWKSREIRGKIKTITIKRDYRNHLFMNIVTDYEPESQLTRTNKNAGFDFGLKSFLTSSDGKTYDAPRSYNKHYQALRRAQQSVSKKIKGSNRRRKAIQHLNKIHTKITNSRKDWQYKLANQLVNDYDILVFENLSFKGMSKMWGRKLHDLSPSSFFDRIQWIAHKHAKEVRFIDRWFPSTKICHVCGTINNSLTLKDRQWICKCGAIHNRDINAAVNILVEGTSSIGVGDSKTSLPFGNGAVAVDTENPT